MKFRHITTLFLAILITIQVKAQDPQRFANEVEEITSKETVVFTGSSSVRMWKDVQSYFPSVYAINSGFGGSHYSDLLYYQKELIFDFNPDRVFIYEGDNDIADKEAPEDILLEAKELIANIKANLPDTKIYIISPKPSISRWNLHKEYESLNALLEEYCAATDGVTYVDVWNPMLNKDGEPMKDIFIEDNLHMNKKGYDIWGSVVGKFIED
ncbi:MAG TPA: G-D-S-L family lipolytic protein [Balneolaceae bacterium]|nr:G-D-S-L family lipolytic protein [Balneolaceae bacterium]|tara:strand:+ start:579 stop:1214 length:636 start_codon:yes stop_codon:yes gene_type:complete